MVVLRAIGNFFCRIGRWIRDTAWVQPLLIVGGIFAVIFSIPYIVNAIEDATAPGDEAKQFYNEYKVSLNGSKTNESKADELFTYITEDEKTADDKKQFGSKFFVTFVKDGHEDSKAIYSGFKTLKENWNQGEFKPTNANEEFKLYTIFVDEATDDEGLKDTQTAFKEYFYANHVEFFTEAATAGETRPYFDNQGGYDSSYYNSLQNFADPETYPVPTTFLFDFENPNHPEFAKNYGISETLFKFSPRDGKETSFGYASTLIDAWNHTGVFDVIED